MSEVGGVSDSVWKGARSSGGVCYPGNTFPSLFAGANAGSHGSTLLRPPVRLGVLSSSALILLFSLANGDRRAHTDTEVRSHSLSRLRRKRQREARGFWISPNEGGGAGSG